MAAAAAGLALVSGVRSSAGNADGPFFTYVGRIGSDSVLLAWGTTAGANTIGRSSASHGPAEVLLDGVARPVPGGQNWVELTGLEPDRSYAYQVRLPGRPIGSGSVRTYPRAARRLSFLVIGDFGSGRPEQRRLGEAMARLVEQRRASDDPVRFVLTTGDNIYGWLTQFSTGDSDKHWRAKFFEPYRELLRSVPFYPTLGNHDTDETEDEDDLAAYLDNFFVPGEAVEEGRYYRFEFARFAEFFALDTTNHRLADGRLIYARDGAQARWLEARLRASTASWKIPYFHHPLLTAGPEHRPACNRVPHFAAAFASAGVRAAFTGHEHNFQWSEPVGEARTRYVVTGAGGQLRDDDLDRRIAAAGIELWAAERHFLLVELDDDRMRIRVLGDGGDLPLRDRTGRAAIRTLEVRRDDPGPAGRAACP
jgi:hypothetical protein